MLCLPKSLPFILLTSTIATGLFIASAIGVYTWMMKKRKNSPEESVSIEENSSSSSTSKDGFDELCRLTNGTLDLDRFSTPMRQAIGWLPPDIFPEDLSVMDIEICHVVDRDGSHDPMYPESMELHFLVKQYLLNDIGDGIGAKFVVWRLSLVRKQISPLLVMEIQLPSEADESISSIDADVYIYRNYIIAFYCLWVEDSNSRARILVFKKDSGILLKSVNLMFPFPLLEIYCMQILPGPNRTLFLFSQSSNVEGFSFRILKFQLEGNRCSTQGEVVHDKKVGTNLKYTVRSHA